MAAIAMAGLSRGRNGRYQARKGIPKDVRAAYAKLFGPAWEATWTAPAGLSASEAKSGYAAWLAEVEARIASIRAGQAGRGATLTHKKAHALAGEWYLWFTARHEGAAGETFDAFVERIEAQYPSAMWEGRYDLDEWLEEPHVRAGIRPIVAAWAETEQFLAGRGLALLDGARDMFLDAVTKNYLAALGLLARRARGDYSPDPLPSTFPAWEAPGGAGKPARRGATLGPLAVFDAWAAAAAPARSTVVKWRAIFRHMEARFPDAGSIPEDEARAWARALVTPERSAGTVALWLKAARTVFRWGLAEKLVRANPWREIKVTVPRRTITRDKSFMPDEAAIILAAALASDRPVRRWVPWLLAYSGARVGEILQLRGVDIEQHGAIWAMRLTPEAGSIKTRTARLVPLHEHLLAMGFLDFVASRGSGRLFGGPGQAAGLARWVRGLGVDDLAISPNHAWRHTFKLRADRSGMSEKASDALTGHSPASQGRRYGAPAVEDLSRAVAKLPRFDVG